MFVGICSSSESFSVTRFSSCFSQTSSLIRKILSRLEISLDKMFLLQIEHLQEQFFSSQAASFDKNFYLHFRHWTIVFLIASLSAKAMFRRSVIATIKMIDQPTSSKDSGPIKSSVMQSEMFKHRYTPKSLNSSILLLNVVSKGFADPR